MTILVTTAPKRLLLEVLIAAFLKKRMAILVTTAPKRLLLEVLMATFLKKCMAILVTTAPKRLLLEVLIAAFLTQGDTGYDCSQESRFRSTSDCVPEETH